MLDELRDIVQGEARFEITEIACTHLESPPLSSGPPVFEPPAQHIVDDFAERTAGPLRFRLELGGHVVVEGQRRAHVLMLYLRHHDVRHTAAV